MNNISKSAFTLAEVLITLAIVGVIAAITIPSLLSNSHKKENVVDLKKKAAKIKHVVYMLRGENGSIE